MSDEYVRCGRHELFSSGVQPFCRCLRTEKMPGFRHALPRQIPKESKVYPVLTPCNGNRDEFSLVYGELFWQRRVNEG